MSQWPRPLCESRSFEGFQNDGAASAAATALPAFKRLWLLSGFRSRLYFLAGCWRSDSILSGSVPLFRPDLAGWFPRPVIAYGQTPVSLSYISSIERVKWTACYIYTFLFFGTANFFKHFHAFNLFLYQIGVSVKFRYHTPLYMPLNHVLI